MRVTGSFGSRRAEPRPPARRRAQLRELRDPPARARAAAVVAGQPVPVPGALHACATAAGASLGYKLNSGIRSITIADGRLMLNGRPVSLRGVGLHEDDPLKGFAIDSARRAQIVAQAKELGATVIRSHYPLHPEMHELADRLGPARLVGDPRLRGQDAVPQARDRPQARRARARGQHHRQPEPPLDHAVVDRQRAVGAAGPGAAVLHRAGGASGQGAGPVAPGRRSPSRATRRPAVGRSTRRSTSSASTTTSAGTPAPTVRSPTATRCRTTSTPCAPAIRSKAIFVSEFGAEANRDGPVEEKGTYHTSRTSSTTTSPSTARGRG